jgi:hypothetical protein
MHRTWKTVATTALAVLLLTPAHARADETATDEAHAGEQEQSTSVFHLNRFANWPFLSFLEDETDDNQTWGIEFESTLTLSRYEVKNILYFEINQYERGVPGQPPGNPEPAVEPANGIGDILSGFWISKRSGGGHHGKHHFAPGFAMQFPTAVSDTLGSGKWAIGPSFDYEYESGRLFAGAIALQIWSIAGDADRKDVSMLMIKPFVIFSLAENWDLLYLPYGVTVYWNKPPGEKVYLPLGGGIQRSFELGSVRLNLAAQYFRNVVRPTKGTVRDLRFLLELEF